MYNYRRFLTRLVAALSVIVTARNIDAAMATVTKDTYVTSANPTQNFHDNPILNVSGASNALVGFDLQSVLPAHTSVNQVTKATLHLWVNKASPNPVGAISVQLADRAWTGPTVTFASPTNPAPLAIPKATHATAGGNNELAIDVTEHVKKMVAAPLTDFGFVILAADPRTNIDFDSKEGNHPAILDVTLISQRSFAVCIEQHSINEPVPQCDCKNGTTLYSTQTLGTCVATSDTGECGATGSFGQFWAVCCVCLPFPQP